MKHMHWVILLCCTFWNVSILAADKPIAMQARDMATEVCAGCHGTDGFSQVEDFPRLAGQKQTYLTKQLKDFRDGRRKDPLMSPMAAPLSDQLIESLAQHFSTRKSR
jgi:cytochrome c553